MKSASWSLSRVRLFVTPWTVAHQAPLSMEFYRQGFWSGLPFPSPVDLFNPGIKPRSPALQVDSLSTEPPGKPTLRSKKGGSRNCLENSRDGRVWWAAVYGVAQSRTGLKRLSSSSKWSNLTCHCFDFYKSATKEKTPLYFCICLFSKCFHI